MILQNNTINIINGDNFGTITESKINEKKLQKLFGILSGLYKNIHESIVREYASNCWDSHRSVGKEDTPIMINLVDSENDSFISFQDFGSGMSPETMNNIYFNYLDSTKEDDNDVIGAFGLGSKSALSYTHTFFIDTIWDGILYHYIFSKQSNGIPAGELIYTEKTDECNGTTVKIPIKKDDLYLFHTAIEAQLIYFPNVYVESPYYFINSFTIYNFEDFLYRPDSGISTLHMCVGNVYYPIDYGELKIDPIKLPIALKFDIGELMPTPSREDIVYSKESISAINNKISKVFQFITNKINEKAVEIKSIADYAPFYGEKNNVLEISDGLNITIPKSLLNNKDYFPDVKLPQIKGATKYMDSDMIYELRYFGWRYFDNEIRNSGYLGTTSLNRLSNWQIDDIKHHLINKHFLYNMYALVMSQNIGTTYLLGNDEFPNVFNKNKYLSDKNHCKIRFMKKIKLSLKEIRQIFLDNIPKSEWRNTLKTLTNLVDEYIYSTYQKYSDVVIDEKWLADNREKNRLAAENAMRIRNINKNKIVYEYLSKDYTYGYVWNKSEGTINEIRNRSKYIIHVPPTEKKAAKNLHSILNSVKLKSRDGKEKDNIFSVIAISKIHTKKFNDDKFISYDDFLTGKSNILKNIATAKLVYDYIGRVKDRYTCDIFKNINIDYYNLAIKLKNNYDKYLHGQGYRDDSILELIVKNMKAIDNLDHYLIKEANRYKFINSKMNNIFRFIDKSFHIDNWNYNHYLYIKSMMEQENLEVNRYFYYKPEFNPLINKQ